MSPSSSKKGIVRLIQPWPNYIDKRGRIGRRHYGIDIMCGYYKDDYMQSIENSKVVEVFEGNSKKSGRVVLEGVSGFTVVYKHIGEFGVMEGDIIGTGVKLGVPNYTNTKSKHLHFEVWDDGTNYNPLLYLTNVCPCLRYEFTTTYPIERYYEKNDPDLYDRLNIIQKKDEVW